MFTALFNVFQQENPINIYSICQKHNNKIELMTHNNYIINFKQLANILEKHYFINGKINKKSIKIIYHQNKNACDYQGVCPCTNVSMCHKNCQIMTMHIENANVHYSSKCFYEINTTPNNLTASITKEFNDFIIQILENHHEKIFIKSTIGHVNKLTICCIILCSLCITFAYLSST
jgi:hypothetical protein